MRSRDRSRWSWRAAAKSRPWPVWSEEEGGDQIWVAADDAELAAELLFPVGHVTYPLPPPVREAGV